MLPLRSCCFLILSDFRLRVAQFFLEVVATQDVSMLYRGITKCPCLKLLLLLAKNITLFHQQKCKSTHISGVLLPYRSLVQLSLAASHIMVFYMAGELQLADH